MNGCLTQLEEKIATSLGLCLNNSFSINTYNLFHKIVLNVWGQQKGYSTDIERDGYFTIEDEFKPKNEGV